METNDKSKQPPASNGPGSNKDWQGVDKDPNEEKGKAEEVTTADLKGKKVDGDPTLPADKPLKQQK